MCPKKPTRAPRARARYTKGMNTFMRAVINGFGFSLGAALFKRFQGQLGLENQDSANQVKPDEAKTDPEPVEDDGSEPVEA